MKISRLLMAAVVIVALPACSGISVDSVYDVQYDFTDLNSYAWEAKQPEQGPDLPYDLLDRWIKDSVDTTLAAKGYTKTTSQPSFKVIYYIGVDEITGINTTYYGGGWGGYWGLRRGNGDDRHPRPGSGGRPDLARQRQGHGEQ